MTKKEFLNLKYQQLCQELGDSQIKHDQLSDHIKVLKSRILELNSSSILMDELDTRNQTFTEAAEQAFKEV